VRLDQQCIVGRERDMRVVATPPPLLRRISSEAMIFDAHHVIARFSTIADLVGIYFATKHLEPITNFLLAIGAGLAAFSAVALVIMLFWDW
jgi:hypothetical protein